MALDSFREFTEFDEGLSDRDRGKRPEPDWMKGPFHCILCGKEVPAEVFDPFNGLPCPHCGNRR